MELNTLGFGILEGYCIIVSPFKVSSSKCFQFFAIFLCTICNKKAGNIGNIAGCRCARMLLLNSGEEESKIDKEMDW